MRIPLGDFLRLFVKGKFRAVLDAIKGTTIKVGGTEIALSEKQGMGGNVTPFERPHKPGGFGR